MSRPMSGRGGPADFGAQQRAARADREQIRRLVQTIPKPPKPPPATGGGGIVGISLIYISGVNIGTGGPSYSVSGTSATIEAYGVTGAPPAAAGVTVDNVDWPGFFQIAEAGCYSFRVLATIGFQKSGGVPTMARLALTRDLVWNDHQKAVMVFDGAAAPDGYIDAAAQVVWDDWTIGPQYVMAGDNCRPLLRVRAPSQPVLSTSNYSLTVEVTRYAD